MLALDMNCFISGTLRLRHQLWIFLPLYILGFFTSTMNVFTLAQQAQINSSYSSTNLTIIEGGNAILACSVYGDPRPAVIWSHDQHSSRKDIECRIEDFTTAGGCITDDVVILRNITRECAGVYHCETYNDIGPHTMHDMNVEVHFIPDITIPNTEVSQSKGRNAILECSIASVPVTAISWRRNGQKLETSEKYSIVNYSDNDFTITLVLKVTSLEEPDEGVYKCMASNYLGKTTKEVQLSVALPPHVQAVQKSYTAPMKQSVTLQCLIQSTPIRSYAWQKNGYDIQLSKKHEMTIDTIDETHLNISLTIHKLDVHDSGPYVCVVVNPAGIARDSISLDVVLPVEISVPVKEVNGLHRKEAALECQISGSPINSVYWTGPDGKNLSRSDKYSVNMYNEGGTDVTMVLVISNLDHTDKGKYHCVATNDVQVSKGAILLQVKLDLPFCEQLSSDIPMCKSIPYNTTTFPNHMGHTTATEAYEDISRFWPLVKSKCSLQLRPFLCAMYFPKCTAYGDSLLPCRSLCYRGKRGCLDVLTAYKMEWPEQFNCRNLPDTDCYNTMDKIVRPATTTPAPSICERITAITPMCLIDISYEKTRFPNIFGHETALEAHADMAQYWPLLEIGCAPEMRQLLCSLYVPKCSNEGREWLPCKDLCKKAKYGCLSVMKQYNFPWPDNLECNTLPENNCVSLQKQEEMCQDIAVDVCHTLPYRTTKFPNNVGDDTQQEAAAHIQQFKPIIDMDCAPEFEVLICSTYLPQCTDTGQLLKPCKDLCEKAKAGCELLAFQYGYTWPEALSCQDLPTDENCFRVHFPTSKPKIECEEIREPLCYNLPYNTTGFPNNLNHLNQIDAAIELQQFLPLIQVECAPELQLFLCSLYMPACEESGEIIKPCKNLCEKSRAGCEPLMNKFGFEWPDLLHCDWLPEDDHCITTTQDEDMCERLTLPFCSDMPYNTTAYPNIMSHSSQVEVEKRLLQYLPLVSINCAPELQPFLCSLYAPQCLGNGTIIHPCRNLCEKLQAACQATVESIGFVWPKELSCSDLPSYEPCFNIDITVDKQCEDIHISLCEDLPYNATRFPNILNHTNQNEAQLELQKFLPFLNTECAPELKPFLCSVYVPKCPLKGENIPKPCKELCLKSKLGCETFMNRIGMDWPDLLSCESLPDNDGCVNINTIGDEVAETETCEDIDSRICEILPYNTTIFPNLLSHETQQEAQVHFLKFLEVINTGCAWELEYFLCSAYFPECSSPGDVIKPCRNICELSRNACNNVIDELEIVWPPELRCEDLPQDNCSDFNNIVAETETCEDINSEICEILPYNTTIFPNLLSHETEQEAQVHFFKFLEVINSGCAWEMEYFLCSAYFPECTSPGDVIKPCRNICEISRNACNNTMGKLEIVWPPELRCEDLPQDNCSDFNNIVTETVTCEDINSRICEILPYNTTIFPNLLSHETEQEAQVHFFKFLEVINSGCAWELEYFLCSAYFPECRSPGDVIKPCRNICEISRNACNNIMGELEIVWPPELRCEDFPQDNCSDFNNIGDSHCEPIDPGLSLCENVRYNATKFPNLFSHKTQEEAKSKLNQYYPLVGTNCSPTLQELLCSLHFPQCNTSGQTKKPCRSFCEKTLLDCNPSLEKLGLLWPSTLSCDNLPNEGCYTHKQDDISKQKCEDIITPLCQGLSYNQTKFPNFFDHATQEEAELELQQFFPLIKVDCAENLKSFLCSMFIPKCSFTGDIVKPCRELCEISRSGCETFMNRVGIEWPQKLACDALPRAGTCFNTIEADHQKCEPIRIRQCMDVAYNKTQLPNMLSHQTQQEAENQLSTFEPLLQSGCSPALKSFLCAIFVPECSISGNTTRPCHSLCIAVKDSCKMTMERYGISWPKTLSCDDLPEDHTCFSVNVFEKQCENISLSMCQHLPYNETQFPNIFSHNNQEEAETELHVFLPLLKINCSPMLKSFLCAMYVPKCSVSGNITKPCRSLCKSVKSDCAIAIERLGLSLSKALSCDDLPESGKCFNIDLPARSMCEEITLPLCMDINYNKTNFPNLLSHESQDQAKKDLDTFLPIVNSGCSPALKHFLCSMYVPNCSMFANITKPCKHLCEVVKGECEMEMERLGIPWPEQFSCELLPENNTCLDVDFEEPPVQLCQDIDIRRCQNIGYNRTMFPNQMVQTPREAYAKLSQYIPLRYYGCSETLMPFVCSLYVPPCQEGITEHGRPCKSLCEEAKAGCESIMNKLGYKWKGDIVCDNFQDDKNCFSFGVKKKAMLSSCGNTYCQSKGTNKQCDAECDNFDCEFDNRECAFGVFPYKECYAIKSGVPCDKLFHNGKCDIECNNERCLYDGFDCQGPRRRCSPLYESYCRINFGDDECDLGCSPAYCGFDGGDCIQTPLYLKGYLAITFALHPQEFQARSSEILRNLALEVHTVIFLAKDDQNKPKIEEDKTLPEGTVIQTIDLDGVAKSDLNVGTKAYFRIEFGSCMEEYPSRECFRTPESMAQYLAMAIRVGSIDNTTLPIFNIDPGKT